MTTERQATSVARALLIGIGLLVRRLKAERAPGDLSPSEASAIARLERGGPSTAASLAKLEQISAQSMGAIVDALESRGFVARAADPDDGRRSILTATPAAVALLRRKRDARATAVGKILRESFTSHEIASLERAAPLIERLAESL